MTTMTIPVGFAISCGDRELAELSVAQQNVSALFHR
jgi:hypothetical protein